MIHDPMCPYTPERQGFSGMNAGISSALSYVPGLPCLCDLIAKVREDERERCVTAVKCWTDLVNEVDEREMVFVDEAVYQIRNPNIGHPHYCGHGDSA